MMRARLSISVWVSNVRAVRLGGLVGLLCVLAATSAVCGPDPSWLWPPMQIGTNTMDTVNSVASHESGVYVAGMTRGTLPGQTASGLGDAFIGKLDHRCRAGWYEYDQLWTSQFGTSSEDAAVSVACHASGVYVAGWTEGALPGLASLGKSDAFIRKYNHAGGLLWTRQFGTAEDDAVASIASDASGVYVVGRTGGALPGLASLGKSDAFICKYNHTGVLLWTRQFGTAENDAATSIACDLVSVYVAGTTMGVFGTSSSGGIDAFVAKYSFDGASVVRKQFGTAYQDTATSVACDGIYVYVAGQTSGLFPEQTKPGKEYSADAFVCCLLPLDLSTLWLRQFGTDDEGTEEYSNLLDEATSVACDASGVYVAGRVAGALPDQVFLGMQDAFIRKYTQNGITIWTSQFDSPESDRMAGWEGASLSLACAASGVYVAGKMYFGNRLSGFLTKYDPCADRLVHQGWFYPDGFAKYPPTYVEGHDGSPEGALLLDGQQYTFSRRGPPFPLPIAANDSYSVSLWVKGHPGQVGRYVLSESLSDTQTMNPAWGLCTEADGEGKALGVYIRDDQFTERTCHRKSQRDVFDDTWHHIVWVDKRGEAALYIDGIRDETDFSYLRSPLSPDTTTVGAVFRETACCYFTGAVDDLRFYDGALGLWDVQTLLRAPTDCPPEGDTRCASVTVEGPGTAGTYVATAHGATDDSGDPILYHFAAVPRPGVIHYMQVGPQSSNQAEFFLVPAEWTITVTVDDDLSCRDTVPEARRSTVVSVREGAKHTVARWDLDGNLQDSSGSGNHGAMAGGQPAVYVPGHDGTPQGAVELDGNDDYIQVTQHSGLPISSQPFFTIALWVKAPPPTISVRGRHVFAESSNSSNTPLFGLATDSAGLNGKLFPYVRNDAGCAIVTGGLSQTDVFDRTWHHIAWVDAHGDVTLYVDGEPDPSNFDYTRDLISSDTTAIGGIQRAGSTNKAPFLGAVDDVRLYDYALTQDEVRAAMSGSEGETLFRRSDANGDGTSDISDAVTVLNVLFLGTGSITCRKAADANDDGKIDISDAVRVLNFHFLGGPAPPPPYPGCGVESSSDELPCETYPKCP